MSPRNKRKGKQRIKKKDKAGKGLWLNEKEEKKIERELGLSCLIQLREWWWLGGGQFEVGEAMSWEERGCYLMAKGAI